MHKVKYLQADLHLVFEVKLLNKILVLGKALQITKKVFSYFFLANNFYSEWKNMLMTCGLLFPIINF